MNPKSSGHTVAGVYRRHMWLQDVVLVGTSPWTSPSLRYIALNFELSALPENLRADRFCCISKKWVFGRYARAGKSGKHTFWNNTANGRPNNALNGPNCVQNLARIICYWFQTLFGKTEIFVPSLIFAKKYDFRNFHSKYIVFKSCL